MPSNLFMRNVTDVEKKAKVNSPNLRTNGLQTSTMKDFITEEKAKFLKKQARTQSLNNEVRRLEMRNEPEEGKL